MLRGPATVNFWADDVEAAKAWYAELLGVDAYFERPGPDGRPAYVEFRFGDYQSELGIINSRFRPSGAGTEPGGVMLYWHVDDLDETYSRLLAMGAAEYEGPVERGEGFVTASVIDPFGNILGVMYNAHFVEVAGAIES